MHPIRSRDGKGRRESYSRFLVEPQVFGGITVDEVLDTKVAGVKGREEEDKAAYRTFIL